MELNEAIRRILRPHLGIVVVCLLLGLGAGTFLYVQEDEDYAASVRVVLDTPDPKSAAESQSIADFARAVVTSPGLVADALRQMDVASTPETVGVFATENVALQAMGSSNVLQLTVLAPDPGDAAEIANVLANGLIDARLGWSSRGLEIALAYLDVRLEELDEQIQRISVRLASARAIKPAMDASLQGLIRRRSDVASERALLLAEQGQRLRPSIVDQARPPSSPVPSRGVPYIGLGGLLGLIAGVALASILELFRPTLVGPDAVAREVNAVVLGELPKHPSEGDDWWLAPRIRLAAGAARAGSVELVDLAPAGSSATASLLAARLDPPIGSAYKAQPGLSAHVNRRDSEIHPSGNGKAADAGVVLVAPSVVKRADLRWVDDVLRATQQRLLGVIIHRSRSIPKDLVREAGSVKQFGSYGFGDAT